MFLFVRVIRAVCEVFEADNLRRGSQLKGESIEWEVNQIEWLLNFESNLQSFILWSREPLKYANESFSYQPSVYTYISRSDVNLSKRYKKKLFLL